MMCLVCAEERGHLPGCPGSRFVAIRYVLNIQAVLMPPPPVPFKTYGGWTIRDVQSGEDWIVVVWTLD